ncbi:MAG: hypothetical protein ABSE82_07280 [Nitrososphaerales archaeon]
MKRQTELEKGQWTPESATRGVVTYVEFANGNYVEYTIVLINGELYCVSPNDNIPSEPACPGVISTSNSISTTSPTT